MRFSIIVPVYNVEKYIGKCLASMLEQSFSDFEVIVVDDQTPDNSMQVVQAFVDADPVRFRVIHQENKGLGGARNTGVDAATGEYILFVDSDDFIHPDTLQILNRHLCETPCDILEFNYQEVSPEGKLLKRQTISDKNAVYTQVQEKGLLMLSPPIACNKAYRRAFFISTNVRFPEKTRYEDSVTRILLAKAQSVGRCTEYLYNYVQRDGSIMHSQISPRVLDMAKVADQVYQVFAEEGMLHDYGQPLEAALVVSLIRVAADVAEGDPSSPLLQQLVEYTAKKFPNCLENQYLTGDLKKKLTCLSNGDISGYRKYDRIMSVKNFILQFSLVRRLNDLRKRR